MIQQLVGHQHDSDEEVKRCPRCGEPLTCKARYPVLVTGTATAFDQERNRIRYRRAWICGHRGCDYRELLGDAER